MLFSFVILYRYKRLKIRIFRVKTHLYCENSLKVFVYIRDYYIFYISRSKNERDI